MAGAASTTLQKLVKNADGYDGVAARKSPPAEPEWDIPNLSVVDVLEEWVECDFKEHHGFIKARNLPGVEKLAVGSTATVKDSYAGNEETCMRRSATQESSDSNVLCYVPNGPGAVTLRDRWTEVSWNGKRCFLKPRHLQEPGDSGPPAKKVKLAESAGPASSTGFLTQDMLGPPLDLLVDDQPDWNFELEKGKWKSYRPEDSVFLDRFWKAFDADKSKPHIAKIRLMKKDVVVNLKDLTCQMAGGTPRSLRRQVIDPGWLSNNFFCMAFKQALDHAGMKSGTPEETFDFRFNQDFRELKDDGRELLRGGERYELPIGWKRFSVKVQGQYDDGDNSWLKEDSTGWAVAYHGTSGDSLPGILSAGFKAGPGQKFASETGAGIYCTPWIDVAQHYSEPKPVEGRCVQVVLQLRVKPSAIKKVTTAPTPIENKYWVINDTKCIRAYGVLIREFAIRDYKPALYAVYGPTNSSVKQLMAELRKKADAFEKSQGKSGAAKAKPKAKAK